MISKINLANLEKLGALIAEELVEETSRRLLSVAEASIDFEDDTDLVSEIDTFYDSFKGLKGGNAKVMGNVTPDAYLENYGYGVYEDRGTEEAVRIGVVEGKYFIQKTIERLEAEIDIIINEKRW